MKKKRGPGLCNCQPLLGHPQRTSNTLMCSICGFEASARPLLSNSAIPKRDMERRFKMVWSPEDRAQYTYFFELMKPYEQTELQAARTAYWKVERMRDNGIIEKVRALAEA